MKYQRTAVFLLTLFPTVLFAQANTDSEACEMILCLQEEEMNNKDVVNACTDAQKKFFKIIKKRHKKVDIPGTVKKRKNKLEQCAPDNDKEIREIIARWGAVIDPFEATKL